MKRIDPFMKTAVPFMEKGFRRNMLLPREHVFPAGKPAAKRGSTFRMLTILIPRKALGLGVNLFSRFRFIKLGLNIVFLMKYGSEE